MKHGTKILLATGFLLITVELLCVPFAVRYGNGLSLTIGFGFVLSPPEWQGVGDVIIRWHYVMAEIAASVVAVVAMYAVKAFSDKLETRTQ